MLCSFTIQTLDHFNYPQWNSALKDTCNTADFYWIIEKTVQKPPKLEESDKANMKHAIWSLIGR